MAPHLHPFPNRSPSRQRENPLCLRKLWNKDACKGSGNQQDGFLSLAPVGRGGEVREVSRVLTVIKKKPPSHDGSRYPPGMPAGCAHLRAGFRQLAQPGGEAAEAGRFLEFLETLKKAGAELDVSNLAVIQRAATGTCVNRNETPCRCWRRF